MVFRSRLRVLLVEDNPPDVALMRASLEAEGTSSRIELVLATTLEDALVRLGGERFDAVLLDLSLPDAVGLEALEAVIAEHDEVPVVVCTGLDDVLMAERALQSGAQDYLVKGRVDGYHASRALWNAIERKRKEERIRRAAFFDELTGLPNRALLLDRVERAIARGMRDPARPFALLYLDVDRFKQINDTFGHSVGDAFLVGVAGRLRCCLRPGDTVARLGGDEFVLLLAEVARVRDALRVAERVQSAMVRPLCLEGQDVQSTVSIGVAFVPPRAHMRPEDLLRRADLALYRAKARGRGHTELFDAEMREQVLEGLRLDAELRSALQRGELAVHYQPILRLKDGGLKGFEALVRWPRAEGGERAPLEFLPTAEETGLIHAVRNMVLGEACAFLASLPPGKERLTMHVNLSVSCFRHPELRAELERALAEAGIEPRRLHLEIRELSLEEEELAASRIDGLRELGVRLHVDDFGTGSSCLAALERLPLEGLKIGRDFLRRAWRIQRGPGPVRGILVLARDLGLEVAAAGIENRTQLEGLRELGCPAGQGFLLGRPMERAQAAVLAESSV